MMCTCEPVLTRPSARSARCGAVDRSASRSRLTWRPAGVAGLLPPCPGDVPALLGVTSMGCAARSSPPNPCRRQQVVAKLQLGERALWCVLPSSQRPVPIPLHIYALCQPEPQLPSWLPAQQEALHILADVQRPALQTMLKRAGGGRACGLAPPGVRALGGDAMWPPLAAAAKGEAAGGEASVAASAWACAASGEAEPPRCGAVGAGSSPG